MPTKSPIRIPETIAQDKAIRNLITQWRNLHLRHRECRRRISWKNAKASQLEKRRRREQWECVARILEIERQILAWVADETHHPEIYTTPRGTRSRLSRLEWKYHRNQRIAHNAFFFERLGFASKTAMRAQYRRDRMIIVSEIRGIRRAWLSAIYTAVYPDGQVPMPLALHPAELVPRKLRVARRKIRQEMAA